MKISSIIETSELLNIHTNPNVLIFDVSNHIEATSNYEKEHLEGAIFVNLNTQLADIKDDLSNGGRHPLPNIEAFAQTLTELGVTKNSHIILYDDKHGANAAARFWWMLKSVGHKKVQVLNGGMHEAKKQNFPLSSKPEVVKKASEPYKADTWSLPTVEMNDIEKVSLDKNYMVVDVREKDRYDGKTEPIDLIAGHIPEAVNIPFTENLDDLGLFLKPSEIRSKYKVAFGNTAPENIIIHCGSGVTACHTLLSLAYADMDIPKLYVGSWSEWSRNHKEIERNNH